MLPLSLWLYLFPLRTLIACVHASSVPVHPGTDPVALIAAGAMAETETSLNGLKDTESPTHNGQKGETRPAAAPQATSDPYWFSRWWPAVPLDSLDPKLPLAVSVHVFCFLRHPNFNCYFYDLAWAVEPKLLFKELPVIILGCRSGPDSSKTYPYLWRG